LSVISCSILSVFAEIFTPLRQKERKSVKRERRRKRKKGRRKNAKKKTGRRRERRKRGRIDQGEMKWILMVLMWRTMVQKIRKEIKKRNIRDATMTQMM